MFAIMQRAEAVITLRRAHKEAGREARPAVCKTTMGGAGRALRSMRNYTHTKIKLKCDKTMGDTGKVTNWKAAWSPPLYLHEDICLHCPLALWEIPLRPLLGLLRTVMRTGFFSPTNTIISLKPSQQPKPETSTHPSSL